jgi:hypothetical protein
MSIFPVQLYAYPHGYRRHTDEIYAIARHDLAVYTDESGDELIEYIPPFTGFRVIYVGDSWREIEYTTKGEEKIGWITEGDFYSDCLYYDGRDKQILADGTYRFTYKADAPKKEGLILTSPSQKKYRNFTYNLVLTYEGHNAFVIMNKDTHQFLKRDTLNSESRSCEWGPDYKAGLFVIEKEGDKYTIRDKFTGYSLCQGENGSLYFQPEGAALFKVKRTDGKVIDRNNLRVYVQYDADWAKDHYGSGKKKTSTSNNFCTSACGIFAAMNAIYTLTGKYIDPHLLADFAVDEEYRILDNGTDSGIFYAAASHFGKDYGFKFDGEDGSIYTLRKKLNKGDVAIAHVPGHYVAIVDYNKRTGKYLLLDSHYLPKRETCPYGDWVSASVLEGGSNLSSQMYYFYKLRKD